MNRLFWFARLLDWQVFILIGKMTEAEVIIFEFNKIFDGNDKVSYGRNKVGRRWLMGW